VRDLDFDGRDEAVLSAGERKAYVRPRGGGHLYELDMLEAGFNPLASMTRRFEDYHREVRTAPAPGEAVKTIHDRRPVKDATVKEGLIYDRVRRASAVDHFFGPGTDLAGLEKASFPEAGDFDAGDYLVKEAGPGAQLTLTRLGTVRQGEKVVPLNMEKRFSLDTDAGAVRIAYRLLADARLDASFGAEFNFAMLSGTSDDRFYFDEADKPIGPLGLSRAFDGIGFLGLADTWQGVRIEMEFDPPASLFVLPVKTVSQSEGGFELLYQQSCVIPWWTVRLKAGRAFEPGVLVRCRHAGTPEAGEGEGAP
jgi:alpha-amylase